MALILDTNAISAFVEGDRSLHEAIEGEPDLALPVIVLGEYLFGIRHSRLRTDYETWLGKHLPLFLTLPVERQTAERYAEIRAELKSAGQPIPSNDLWIASLAREHGYPVVSRDRHFERVRGLRRINW